MPAVAPDALGVWSRTVSNAWRPVPAPVPVEEELWMQKEDVASAWSISVLTAAAVALLVLLAVLG